MISRSSRPATSSPNFSGRGTSHVASCLAWLVPARRAPPSRAYVARARYVAPPCLGSHTMQSRRLIFSACLLIVAITLLQALFGLTSSHVPLHRRPEVKRPADTDPVRRAAEELRIESVRKVAAELRTENKRLRLDNERLRSAVDGHGEQANSGQAQKRTPTEEPPPTETTPRSSWSEGCCEGPAVAESAATGRAHADCAVTPDEQRRQLLSYIDRDAASSTAMCVTSVCRAAARARRGLPVAKHTANGRAWLGSGLALGLGLGSGLGLG